MKEGRVPATYFQNVHFVKSGEQEDTPDALKSGKQKVTPLKPRREVASAKPEKASGRSRPKTITARMNSGTESEVDTKVSDTSGTSGMQRRVPILTQPLRVMCS
jgi:hypothetical protein